ncbi:hypothetical protein OAJ95_02040 [Pelagibacteraceae bacterium]|nr:hypothetical protein [Pelagibacteraceae bacterium]
MKILISLFVILFLFKANATEKHGDIVCLASTSNWCHYNEDCTGMTIEKKTIFDIYLKEKYLHWVEEDNNYQTFSITHSRSYFNDIINFNQSPMYMLIQRNTGKFVRVSGGLTDLSTQHLYGTCKYYD